ncbi:hypothetical protein EMIHUDRAFT_469384, partial [Emiliania huxleyi CCMP1516]|uniref:PROP1-like PPR domain-containing protein n=2 Tax=Emiliania huxleyi TaxID=2903 RepID=A0A0D3JKZ2_EMIH1
MVLPLVPLAVSAGGAAVAGVSGWAFVQYDKLTTQFAQQQAQLHQLQLSAESVQTRTLWSELLEPVAKRWGGALKLIAYSLCAVSGTIIVVGLGRATPTTLQPLKAHRLALRLLSGEVRHNLANRATRRPRPTRGAASAASGRTTLPSAGGSKRTASGRQTRKFPPDWQRRRKHGGENTASPPGTVSLRKKLNRCAQARNVKGALALFASEAESGGVVPDTRSYNVLLGMLVERPDEWWRVRRHMAAAGLPPDEATISLEVRALVNTGDLDAAAETVAAAAARGMPARRRTFASLLEALCGAGRLSAAARIVVSMRRQRIPPGEELLVSLASLCAKAAARGALAELAQAAGRGGASRPAAAAAGSGSDCSSSGGGVGGGVGDGGGGGGGGSGGSGGGGDGGGGGGGGSGGSGGGGDGDG